MPPISTNDGITVLSVPWINPPKSPSDEITRLSPPPAAWHLGARIADLPVFEIAVLGLWAGPQRKGPRTPWDAPNGHRFSGIRRSRWTAAIPRCFGHIDSPAPLLRWPPRAPASEQCSATPRAPPHWACRAPALGSILRKSQLIHYHTLQLQISGMSQIINNPDMDSISIFCGYLWVKGTWYLKSTTASTSE